MQAVMRRLVKHSVWVAVGVAKWDVAALEAACQPNDPVCSLMLVQRGMELISSDSSTKDQAPATMGGEQSTALADAQVAKEEGVDPDKAVREWVRNHHYQAVEAQKLGLTGVPDLEAVAEKQVVAEKPPTAAHSEPVAAVKKSEHPRREPVAQLQLPAVSDLLSKAKGISGSLSDEAQAMQDLVRQGKEATRAKLADTRDTYLSHLHEKKTRNLEVGRQNQNLSKLIVDLNTTALASRKRSKQLQASIHIMTQALKALHPKVELAQAFVEDSLNRTDPRDTEETLKEPTVDMPSLEFYLAEARTKLGLGNESTRHTPTSSLLQVGSAPLPNQDSPYHQALVEAVAQSIEKVQVAEKDAAEKLKASFLEASQSYDSQYTKSMEKQMTLQKTLSWYEALNSNLTAACDTLKHNRQFLKDKLLGMKLFMRRVDTAFNHTQREAEQAILASFRDQ